jgi:hypothetical protein
LPGKTRLLAGILRVFAADELVKRGTSVAAQDRANRLTDFAQANKSGVPVYLFSQLAQEYEFILALASRSRLRYICGDGTPVNQGRKVGCARLMEVGKCGIFSEAVRVP